jgi:hypothetical protein
MHPQQPHFRLTRQAILLGIISAAYPMAGYCVAAGRADFVIGNVEAVAADGSRRALTKGSEISAGDAINTAAGARAQVRFIDGGYVSLQPNTQFRVDQFNYQNKTDGNEQGFFSLLKGGLRAITGAIGHVNRNTYKVATPSATIGIRGTGYKAEIRDDGLFVSVGEGAISLTNNVGLLVVTAGNAAFVANANTAPAPTTEQPQVPPTSLQPVTSPIAIIQPTLPNMASGSGYVMSYAYLGQTGAGVINGINGLTGVTATFNSTSQLTNYSNVNETTSLGTAAVTFSATDGIIGWGRWDGNTLSTGGPMGSGMTPGVFHYVIGQPTAVMPTTGIATYTLMGYTNPTATDGSTGWNVKGDLTVNFAATGGGLGISMVVWNSAKTYTLTGSPNVGATFTGSLTTTGAGCISCSTSVNGFFAGTNASRAGLSYEILGSSSELIQGAAAFASTTPPPPLP